eukprot:scaffold95561_cov36-Cyclotella_meneghiniana.AAC.2
MSDDPYDDDGSTARAILEIPVSVARGAVARVLESPRKTNRPSSSPSVIESPMKRPNVAHTVPNADNQMQVAGMPNVDNQMQVAGMEEGPATHESPAPQVPVTEDVMIHGTFIFKTDTSFRIKPNLHDFKSAIFTS